VCPSLEPCIEVLIFFHHGDVTEARALNPVTYVYFSEAHAEFM